jgi:hypothetical protein
MRQNLPEGFDLTEPDLDNASVGKCGVSKTHASWDYSCDAFIFGRIAANRRKVPLPACSTDRFWLTLL